jgi:hypothetical protein
LVANSRKFSHRKGKQITTPKKRTMTLKKSYDTFL